LKPHRQAVAGPALFALVHLFDQSLRFARRENHRDPAAALLQLDAEHRLLDPTNVLKKR
jgi:hypothetical protein